MNHPFTCTSHPQAIGPDLSALMDKLLGGPGWSDAHRPKDKPLPLSEVRRRLATLEPEERERVPEVSVCFVCLFTPLCWNRTSVGSMSLLVETLRSLKNDKNDETDRVAVPPHSLTQLFTELKGWQAACDRVGRIVEAEEAAEERKSRVGRAR